MARRFAAPRSRRLFIGRSTRYSPFRFVSGVRGWRRLARAYRVPFPGTRRFARRPFRR